MVSASVPAVESSAGPGRFTALQIALIVALSLPWLNPFALRPAPAVVQSLLSVLGLACLLLLPLRRGGLATLAGVVAWAWLLSALLSSGLGLLQYFGLSGAWSPWVNSTLAGEAFANLRQRNHFASLVNIGLMSLLWLASNRQPNTDSPKQVGRPALPLRWLGLLFAAVLLGAGNAASSSRTGLLQLCLALALWLLLWRSSTRTEVRKLLLAAALSYLGAACLLPLLAGLGFGETGILSRLQDTQLMCQSRLIMWRNVLHLIGLQPWSGWGWGELDYAHFITLYPGARFCDILDNAHNLPLHLAVELGLPAALLLCGAALLLIARAKPWAEQHSTRQLAWGVLGVIALHSLLEYPLWYGPFQLAAGLSLLLLWLSRAAASNSADHLLAGPYSSSSGWRLRSALALGLVAGAAYAAIDYARVLQFYLPASARTRLFSEPSLSSAHRSWLFGHWLDFAQATSTPVDAGNATRMQELNEAILHLSPEPRVIERIIRSAALLQRFDVAWFYLQRYQAAFPAEYADWQKRDKQP